MIFRPSKSPLSRRALLRGAGGFALALPFLEAMSPRTARAAGPAPRRLLTVFTENGVVAPNWFPTGNEKAWTMPVSLAPLMPFQKHLIVFEGLGARPLPSPPRATTTAGRSASRSIRPSPTRSA
jgi:hypothetical protein